MNDSNHKSFTINFLLLFKVLFLGAIFTEILMISAVIGSKYVDLSFLYQKENWLWAIGLSYLLIIIFFFFRKGFWRKVWIVVKSLRVDLLIVLFSGVFLIYVFGGFGIGFFKNWINLLSWLQLTVVILLPVIVFISVSLRLLQVKFLAPKNKESLFMSDREGMDKNDDELGFSDQAEGFAERVFNQGSSESLVFGIDAPWGTGKSTFVNLCKEYWSENHKNETIVYTFDLLRYENKENLLEKFIDGLIKEIKNYVFAPEIESLVSKYAKILKDTKTSFSFFGFSFGIPLRSETMDDVFERLETALLNIDKKIIIIIDDLDRLNFSAIKEILFVIKKAFTLPNITYVLCYDTENIMALENKNLDVEKITEFLEKFVNVKTSLYLDNKLLLEYFTENKNKSRSKNLFANPELISKAVEGLKDIFSSKNFHCYLPFIGDVRKLKRLINTIILLEVEKTDFDNSDFNKQDLIHLLLIYINYPNIFRKIYNTETQGKSGFFSAILKYGDKQTIHKNSDDYTKYLETLSDNQKFIVNKVFNVNERLKKLDSSSMSPIEITKEIETSYACFNGSGWGSGGRNLEEYINLITKMSRPLKTGQHKFYVNAKNEVLFDKTIEQIFSGEDFSYSKSESFHEQLWRVLVNTSSKEFTPEKSKEIILYALDKLPQYSLIKIESIGVGFRNMLTFYIAILLNQVGWTDAEKRHSSHNTEENVIKITDWVFGEGDHSEEGVLDIIGKEDRGITGIYDLLLFRLRCCADRGGDLFNLSRALSKHESFDAPTEGDTRVIVTEEMREISQKVFGIFKTQIIDKKKNIFDEIDTLELKDVTGKYFDYIHSNAESECIDLNILLASLKSKLKAFITYQLGNTLINLGIGCGYYDVDGKKDKKGINKAVNDYLFDFCFNPEKNENNYQHFLNYLLINLSHSYSSSHENKYVPHINEFTKVLSRDRLKTYWQNNEVTIKSKNYNSEDRKIFTENYSVNYFDDLENIFKVLDELLDPETDQTSE